MARTPRPSARPSSTLPAAPGTLGGNAPDGRFPRYHQAKLSQALFALELHRRLRRQGSKVKSLSAEPGLVKTNLGVNFLSTFPPFSPFRVIIPLLFPLPEAQPVAHGCVPLLRACFDPVAKGGDLWMHLSWVRGKSRQEVADKARPIKSIEAGNLVEFPGAVSLWEPVRHPEEYCHEKLTYDAAFARRMWAASEAATGGKFNLAQLLHEVEIEGYPISPTH